MVDPIVRNYDKRLYKKCIKCRAWKPREPIELDIDGIITILKPGFGKHDSSDGLQSICHKCKNVMNIKGREQNTTARLRHHISTRCATQLGALMPKGFAANLELHLGYKIKTLVKHLREKLKEREGEGRKLRDALNEGYHIDHIYPLSKFPVIRNDEVNWDVFQDCWSIKNLEAIPAQENLAKGAKVDEDQVSIPDEGSTQEPERCYVDE